MKFYYTRITKYYCNYIRIFYFSFDFIIINLKGIINFIGNEK